MLNLARVTILNVNVVLNFEKTQGQEVEKTILTNQYVVTCVTAASHSE